jgi:hypothetical protein
MTSLSFFSSPQAVAVYNFLQKKRDERKKKTGLILKDQGGIDRKKNMWL